MSRDPHDMIKRDFEDSLIADANDRAAQPLSKIAQLEQLVSNLRRDLQISHQALAKANAERDELKVKGEKATNKLCNCLNALNWFCQRVERGEVRSKTTYSHFRKILSENL